jgi:hypothetical protein
MDVCCAHVAGMCLYPTSANPTFKLGSGAAEEGVQGCSSTEVHALHGSQMRPVWMCIAFDRPRSAWLRTHSCFNPQCLLEVESCNAWWLPRAFWAVPHYLLCLGGHQAVWYVPCWSAVAASTAAQGEAMPAMPHRVAVQGCGRARVWCGFCMACVVTQLCVW